MMPIKQVILFTFLIFSMSHAFAKREQLSIVVGLDKPPYVIQKEQSGFEIELIRNIFKKINIDTAFVFTQYKHSTKMLDAKYIDAVMTTNNKVFTNEAQLSDSYISYQNVAISLKSKNLTIKRIEDLGNYSIAAFQNAEILLGEAYYKSSKRSPLYMSTANQSAQPQLLMKQRVDVIVLDVNIFNYMARELGINDLNSLFSYHYVFPKTNYHIAFKDLTIKYAFNQALANYKNSAEYEVLINKYNF
ncbi:substrate-binding periplasmic protein [Litorilituus lipolyticus]|uniref:Transporter substrate-binding domain-containing protein n=1 Tax=Litorilituus lipolyticus TaxID=2491017 RepID=A0A502L2K5_9GAMM|nr:transporter substrate-binding domain-containing protein [Litorilituus lipolyticus]TPH18142.1 transporter substrate-binding domain-containing protein [Litorilituus lipolyticus]